MSTFILRSPSHNLSFAVSNQAWRGSLAAALQSKMRFFRPGERLSLFVVGHLSGNEHLVAAFDCGTTLDEARLIAQIKRWRGYEHLAKQMLARDEIRFTQLMEALRNQEDQLLRQVECATPEKTHLAHLLH